MKISSGIIEKLISLTKIELTKKEKKRFQNDLESIIQKGKKFEQNTLESKIEEETVSEESLGKDTISQTLSQKQAISNSRYISKGYFKFPFNTLRDE